MFLMNLYRKWRMHRHMKKLMRKALENVGADNIWRPPVEHTRELMRVLRGQNQEKNNGDDELD